LIAEEAPLQNSSTSSVKLAGLDCTFERHELILV
jgi:hypothetical protein